MATQRLLPALQNGLLGLLQGSPAQNQGVAEIQATQMPQQAPLPTGSMSDQTPFTPFEPMKSGGGRFVAEAEENTPWYKDPNVYNQLALGFNSMRLNPDQGLAQALNQRIERAGEMKTRNMTAEKVSLALKNQGRFEEAALVEANPDMAKTVLSAMFTGDRAKSFKFESGADLNTRLGTTVFDPKKPYKLSSTGEISEIGGSGATITNTNTNEAAQAAGSKKYSQEWSVANVAFADEVNKNADNSAALLSQVSNIASNLQGLETGPFEERVAGLRAFAGSIGFPVDKIQLGREQSVTAAARQMVADQLRMNKGPQTDFDAKFAETYLPGFGKTEEANNQIIAYLRSTNKLNVIYANLMGGVAGNGYEEEREVIGRIRDLRRNVPAVAKKDGKWVQFSTYYDNIKSQDSSISDQEIITEWKKRAK